MRNEDYGRISRLLADKRQVELEFEIVNRSYPEGRTSYNTIAEIPGSDKADEVVMLGGHLDSWHAATGATDNAIGCSVMMEAVRILTAIGAKPRRTIRVALWSGEEQGLLGSRAYVRQHFGTFEDQKPEYAKLSAYINMDSGTGRVRGLTAFGPAATGNVLREATASFKDLGMLGATTTRSRGTGGTDSTNFNAAGLPGINTMLDPIQYQTYTWHTNLDTYERIVEDDVKKAAMVIAGTVYHLAMRDELLPRFSKEEMPRSAGAPPAPPRDAALDVWRAGHNRAIELAAVNLLTMSRRTLLGLLAACLTAGCARRAARSRRGRSRFWACRGGEGHRGAARAAVDRARPGRPVHGRHDRIDTRDPGKDQRRQGERGDDGRAGHQSLRAVSGVLLGNRRRDRSRAQAR